MKTKNILILCFLLISIIAHSQTCDTKTDSTPCNDSETLFKASDQGVLDKVKFLVDEKCIDVNKPMKNKMTALHLASKNGHTELVKYLLKKGANVNAKNSWNEAPIHFASIHGHAEIIQLLIDNGAETSSLGGANYTPIHKACWFKKTEAVKVLLKNGVDVNVKNGDGEPPIIAASWMGNPEVLKLLINAGANVNAQTADKSSILHILARRNNHEIIGLILDKGGNANVVNNEGMLPLHSAVKNNSTESATLLLQQTKDINIQDAISGNTPLHLAAINGNTKISESLLNCGADSKMKNNTKLTPTCYAKKYGYSKLTELYASKGLASKKDIKISESARKLVDTDVSYGDALVVYAGHSGFIIKTKEKILVFDYMQAQNKTQPSLANGSFCCDEMKEKDVYVFASHEHGDHYDASICEWDKQIKNINYIFGFHPQKPSSLKDNKSKYTFIEDNDTKQIKDIKVTTIKSNDSGQGFLVEADGVTIYHPGDHAWFSEEDTEVFKKEVDFLASINNDIDIAFLPVSGCPVRWQKEYIVNGFFYNIEQLNPKQVYPMHAFGREHLLKEFQQFAKERNVLTKIICADNVGDNFKYSNKSIASK